MTGPAGAPSSAARSWARCAAAASAASRLGLAEAEHGREPVAEGGRGLRRDDLVGLAEEPAALGVADLGDADADLGELCARRPRR